MLRLALLALVALLLVPSAAAQVWSGSVIRVDCADQAVIDNRGVNGLWLMADWQYEICQREVGLGVSWDACFDENAARYLPCMISAREGCDTIDPSVCWSTEVYQCPFIHVPVGLVKWLDALTGTNLDVHVYIDGVTCGPSDGSVPVTVGPWPDVCTGSTMAEFRDCCLARGGC